MTDDTTLSADRVLEYLSVHARRAEEEGRYKEMIAMDAAALEIERLRTCGVVEAMLANPNVYEYGRALEKTRDEMLRLLRQIACQTDPKWGRKMAREYVDMWRT